MPADVGDVFGRRQADADAQFAQAAPAAAAVDRDLLVVTGAALVGHLARQWIDHGETGIGVLWAALLLPGQDGDDAVAAAEPVGELQRPDEAARIVVGRVL